MDADRKSFVMAVFSFVRAQYGLLTTNAVRFITYEHIGICDECASFGDVFIEIALHNPGCIFLRYSCGLTGWVEFLSLTSGAIGFIHRVIMIP